ncbi:MAG: hypothetical protein R2850_01840 [Bacteroidia bacterium]
MKNLIKYTLCKGFMKGLFLIITILFSPVFVQNMSGQELITDSIRPQPHRGGKLHRWSGPAFFRSEHSIGLMPSLQGGNLWFGGLALSKGGFVAGEGAGSSNGFNLGIDYNPDRNIWAPKLNAWVHVYALVFGANAGLSTFYYRKGVMSNFVIRPEFGIGYMKVFLNYGYNLFLKSEFNDIGRHSVTLSCYLTIFPPDKK